MELNIKQRMKKVVGLRRKAIPHLKALDELVKEACKYTGETPDDYENTFEYIWNGGSVRHTFKMIKLYKEKKFKEVKKELKKRYNF